MLKNNKLKALYMAMFVSGAIGLESCMIISVYDCDTMAGAAFTSFCLMINAFVCMSVDYLWGRGDIKCLTS